MDETTVELLCEILLGAFSGFFLIILIIRDRALSSVARRKTQQFSTRVKNARIGLQFLNIALYSGCLGFQAAGSQLIGDQFSSYARFYSFFWVPPIVAGVGAILIENSEFSLKIPMMIFHFIFYLSQFLISASLLFYFIIEQVRIFFLHTEIVKDKDNLFWKQTNEENDVIGYKSVSRFSRCGAQFLIVVFYFYRRQDISEFMDHGWIIWDLDNELQIPLNEQVDQEDFSRIQQDNSDMEVVFASDISIQNGVPLFKITVKLDPSYNEEDMKQCDLAKKKYEIQQQLSNFLQLSQDIQKEMQKDLASSESTFQEINALNFCQYDNVRSLDHEQVEELRKKLQDLFNMMCNNPKYYYNCFLDFLKIGKGYRQYYLAQKSNIRGDLYEIQDFSKKQMQDIKQFTIDYFEIIIEQQQEVISFYFYWVGLGNEKWREVTGLAFF